MESCLVENSVGSHDLLSLFIEAPSVTTLHMKSIAIDIKLARLSPFYGQI